MRTINYSSDLLPYIQTPKISQDTLLETNIYDLNRNPLSNGDVYALVKTVKDIQGVATLRILPYKANDYKCFASSKIKILKLPLKEIDNEEIPLTLKINQKVRALKREKLLKLKDESPSQNELKIDMLIDNEEFSQFFDFVDYFKIEAYEIYGIKHLIKTYTWHDFNPSNVQKDIGLMLKKLNINNDTGYGFNLILTKNYLFIAPLINPFVYQQNVPLYAEPHYFMGLYTLPRVEAHWPDTVNGEYVKFNLPDILNKSTNE